MTEAPARPLTVASWNVDGWHTLHDAQIRLLDGTGAAVALLQEVTPASADRLRAVGWEVRTALELLPVEHRERAGRRPRFSCAVAVRAGVRITAAHLVPGLPSPVRGLHADLDVAGHPVAVVSAALPPGSMWGRAAKQGQARALAAHLEALAGPVLVGMDRNGPRTEALDPAATVWWDEDDPTLFASDAPHGLRDVLLTWLDGDPDRWREVARVRPAGPLAVTYLERRTEPPAPRRYDVILASADLEVLDVRHDLDGALAAGSDHAVVVAGVRTSE